MPKVEPTKPRDDPKFLMSLVEAVHTVYVKTYLYQTYYGYRMTDFQKYDRTYEIVLAIGSSSAIATWPIWQSGIGQNSWTTMAAIIAVLVILKPFLQYSSKLERYSKLYAAWGELYYGLNSLL